MSRVYVAPISFGLGDLVVSLPAIQALIAQGRRDGDETWLVARSVAQARLAERIAGLAGWVDEAVVRPATTTTVASSTSVTIRSNATGGGVRRSSRTRSEPLLINDILGRICADFGIDADFTRPVPLTACPRPSCARPCSW